MTRTNGSALTWFSYRGGVMDGPAGNPAARKATRKFEETKGRLNERLGCPRIVDAEPSVFLATPNRGRRIDVKRAWPERR
jgi:hypothetical protein